MRETTANETGAPTAEEIFTDPVGYLRAFGIEAELVSEHNSPLASAA